MLIKTLANSLLENSKSMILIIMICVFSFLSFQAYIAFNIKLSERSLNRLTTFNIENTFSFGKQSVLYSSDLWNSKKELIRLSKPLEFMVWPKERRLLSKKIESLLKKQINLTPYDPFLWRKLSFVQADSAASGQDQAWVLLKAVKLGGWNSSERIVLTRHCVANFERLERLIPNRCRELISDLPKSKSLHFYAQKMGITQRYLKWMLEENNIVLIGETYD